MDTIILGILMTQRLTAYEIHIIIRRNFQAMCSGSLGSIQAALKKLESQGAVTVQEVVEKNIRKRRYSITETGRDLLLEWLRQPLDITKTKNIDLGKLLLLGFVPAAERQSLIEQTIQQLEFELAELEILRQGIHEQAERKQSVDRLQNDDEYQNGIRRITANNNMVKNIADISHFYMATLQFGIDNTIFYLNWFRKLRDELAQEKIQKGGKM